MICGQVCGEDWEELVLTLLALLIWFWRIANPLAELDYLFRVN